MENPIQKAFQEPFILLPIVVAVVVILAVIFSRGGKGKPEKAEEKVAVAVTSPVEQASSGGKKKKKRSNKKKSAKSESEREAESSEETADEAKPVVVAAEPKKKSTAAAAVPAAPAPAVVAKPEPVVEEEESSSDEEDELLIPAVVAKKTAVAAAAAAPAAKKTAVTATPAQKAVAAEVAPVPTVVSTHYDGWAVVEDKKFKAKVAKKAEAAAAAAEAAAVAAATAAAAAAAASESEAAKDSDDDEPDTPVVETVTKEIKVDAKKLGLLIGPKGATKIAIQNATATSIQMPKTPKEETIGTVVITIAGPEYGVNKAAQALNELILKGYCALLLPEDFQESYVAVHPKYLKDIIGKGGSVIKALSNHTEVKITVPDNVKAPGLDGKVSKVKVGLSGQREKVQLARSLIKDLTKYYHTTITHPGMVHAELDIPANYYNVIIGAKGSEIKNIQNSHKVSVHIPDADSANPHVVVVGETENVLAAKSHIEKLMVRADERAAAAAAAAAENAAAPTKPTQQAVAAQPATIGEHVIGATVGGGPAWNTNTAVVRKPKAEEAEEEWVKEFAPNSSLSINITSILGENSKFAPVSVQPAAVSAPVVPAPIEKLPAPSSAWNNISTAWNN